MKYSVYTNQPKYLRYVTIGFFVALGVAVALSTVIDFSLLSYLVEEGGYYAIGGFMLLYILAGFGKLEVQSDRVIFKNFLFERTTLFNEVHAFKASCDFSANQVWRNSCGVRFFLIKGGFIHYMLMERFDAVTMIKEQLQEKINLA